MLQGPFETHLTVSVPDAGALEDLRGFGEDRGLKFTWIELSSGPAPVQPMLTRHSSGALTEEHRAVRRISHELSARGWKLERVKIEVEAEHPAVLALVEKSLKRPASRYFEHHVKLLLPREFPPSLPVLCTSHGARVSRNARRVRKDGNEERFLTQRFYRTRLPVARARLLSLRFALEAEGWEILEVEEEYVIFDSRPALDAGWMNPPPFAAR